MRHVLAPTGEDPAGKVVLEGDQVMVAEADIDNVSKFLNCFVKRGSHGTKKKARQDPWSKTQAFKSS
jgi:hypothetical protein